MLPQVAQGQVGQRRRQLAGRLRLERVGGLRAQVGIGQQLLVKKLGRGFGCGAKNGIRARAVELENQAGTAVKIQLQHPVLGPGGHAFHLLAQQVGQQVHGVGAGALEGFGQGQGREAAPQVGFEPKFLPAVGEADDQLVLFLRKASRHPVAAQLRGEGGGKLAQEIVIGVHNVALQRHLQPVIRQPQPRWQLGFHVLVPP